MESEGVILMAAFGVVAILAIVLHFGRSDSLLQQWAAKNEYQIIRQEYRSLFKGPFFWTSTRGQTVYFVVVEDSDGNRHSGWVRCGGWWLGLLSDNVDVRWE